MITRKPTRKTIDKLHRAVGLYADGHGYAAIAKLLGVKLATIHHIRFRYPELWKSELDKRFERLLPEVQAAIGTDAVLEDPQKHIDLCNKLEKWAGVKSNIFTRRTKV